MKSVRAFLAIPVPAAHRQQLCAIGRSIGARGMRWNNPENLHLTLAFLGAIGQPEINTLGNWLKKFTWTTAVELQCEHIAAFPSCSSRLLAVHLAKSPELLALRARLTDQLGAFGIAFDDKAFRPHITLGRGKAGAIPLPPKSLDIKFSAPGIVLFESRVDHQGSIYTPLYTRELGPVSGPDPTR